MRFCRWVKTIYGTRREALGALDVEASGPIPNYVARYCKIEQVPPAPATDPEPSPPKKRAWKLVVSVLLVLLSFNVSFSTGKLSVDRTQQTPFTEWFLLSLAIWWTVSSYRKQASSRVRIWALVVVVPLVALIAFGSFRTGRSEGYPNEARQLVTTLQLHAREVKRLKSELSDARSQFNRPDDRLTLQPNVSALSEHLEEVDRLTHQLAHYELPADLGKIMNLLRQALPTEKRQVEIIERQIAVVRSAQSLGAREKEAAYRQQLPP
jgi:hypothetical protein